MEDQTETTNPDLNPYRNMVIEEVVQSLNQFRGAFGDTTIDSFQVFIRSLKD